MGGINDAIVHVVGGIHDDRRHSRQEERVLIRSNRHGDAGRIGLTGRVDVEIVIPAVYDVDRVAIQAGDDDYLGDIRALGKQIAGLDAETAGVPARIDCDDPVLKSQSTAGTDCRSRLVADHVAAGVDIKSDIRSHAVENQVVMLRVGDHHGVAEPAPPAAQHSSPDLVIPFVSARVDGDRCVGEYESLMDTIIIGRITGQAIRDGHGGRTVAGHVADGVDIKSDGRSHSMKGQVVMLRVGDDDDVPDPVSPSAQHATAHEVVALVSARVDGDRFVYEYEPIIDAVVIRRVTGNAIRDCHRCRTVAGHVPTSVDIKGDIRSHAVEDQVVILHVGDHHGVAYAASPSA